MCGTNRCDDNEYCAEGVCTARKKDSGRGILGWLLLIVAVIVGILVLLVAIGALLRRRERRSAGNAALAAIAAQQADAEAAASSHQIVAHDAYGNPVQAPHPGRTTGHAPAPAARVQPQGRVQPQVGGHAPAAHAASAPTLYVVKGDRQGQRLPIHHGYTIGKAPDCHLVLANDGFASGHHAQILMDTAGGCTLVDKGSTNGTFVNGVRTANMRLQHGMLIRVGATELRFMAQ
jgi:type II secretory pathway pseudopilin PulG